jgi:ribose transport system substrate-binding protein
MIPRGMIDGAGMQQPFLMGEEAVVAMDAHLKGLPVSPTMRLPVLAVSAENIRELMPVIRRNVLGRQYP